LQIFAGVVEFLDDVGHQPKIVFDQLVARFRVPFRHPLQMILLLLLAERLRKGVVFDIGNEQHELLDEQRQRGDETRHGSVSPPWWIGERAAGTALPYPIYVGGRPPVPVRAAAVLRGPRSRPEPPPNLLPVP